MQIKVDNVSYKNLNNITFNIQDKKIIGIVCSDIKKLITIGNMIGNNLKDSGSIKYVPKYSKKNIAVISISDVYEFKEGKVLDYIDLSKIDKEILDLLNIKETLKERNINSLSSSQRIKLLLLKIIICDYDTLIINGIFEELDLTNRKNIIKILINLKKFKQKTIIIGTTDIDIIYEFIDNLVIICDNLCLYSENKFSIFENNNVNNPKIEIPFIKKIENMVYNKSNINLGDNDNINELIKAIYREVR